MSRLGLLLGITALAGGMFPAPASAQSYRMFKWVDERGAVTYSDRRPMDQSVTDEKVTRTISLYTPDPALLRAVEAARVASLRPERHVESPAAAPRRPAPAGAASALVSDPCAQMDCTEYSGGSYYFPGSLPVRHRAPHLHQAVLPAGAIAGTVNAPGMIPGQTGPNPLLPTYPDRLHRARGPLEPPRSPVTGH